ncbi:MAG: hypothetical protein EPO40_12500 [Myxococcaceae bacterium]|nr:MAG: hypothetical protein EPO40_12500 [Myxococcaceae bacterium]
MQRSWLAPLVLLGALSVGGAASAQTPPEGPSAADRAEARRHFQLGVATATRGQWAGALEEFQSAYRLAPHPSVRVNMANCYTHLDRPIEAIAHFEQFLVESPSAPAAQVAQVEAQIAQLRARIGSLQLTVSPPDAMGLAVTVDGQAISLGRPTHVMPGHHVVEALGEGYTTVHREIDIAAGQAQVINLSLERPAAAPAALPVVAPAPTPAVAAAPLPAVAPTAPSEDPHTDAPRRGPPPAVFYAVAGLTGAAAVGWITAGALALSANSDFDATVNEIQGGAGNTAALQARGHDEATRASQLAMWSDVAMGVTLVGTVASVVLFLKTDFRAPVRVGATASSSGATLSVSGSF